MKILISMWLFVACFWCSTGMATIAGNVSADERELVVLLDLEQTTLENYKWLYRYLSSTAEATIFNNLSGSYNRIHMMRNSAALADFIAKINDLGEQDKVRRIDTIVILHGHPESLNFTDGGYSIDDLGARIGQASERARGKLGILLSTSCFGRNHMRGFFNGGYKAASGSFGVNSNGVFEIPAFTRLWASGVAFGSAVTRANTEFGITVSDAAARRMGFTEVDSHKAVAGRVELNINSGVEEQQTTPEVIAAGF